MPRTALALLLCAALSAALPARACDLPANLAQTRDAVLAATNAQRNAAGLPALVLSDALTQAAQTQACDMAAMGTVGHKGRDGSGLADRVDRTGYAWTKIAENAAGWYPTVPEVIAGWMESPGHRKNLLMRGVADLGVGVAVGKEDGKAYWIQVFGKQR